VQLKFGSQSAVFGFDLAEPLVQGATLISQFFVCRKPDSLGRLGLSWGHRLRAPERAFPVELVQVGR